MSWIVFVVDVVHVIKNIEVNLCGCWSALDLGLYCSATMAVALGVLSWSFWFYQDHPPPMFAIGGMAIMSGAYSFSYGPLNWLITAELFTVGVRGILHAHLHTRNFL